MKQEKEQQPRGRYISVVRQSLMVGSIVVGTVYGHAGHKEKPSVREDTMKQDMCHLKANAHCRCKLISIAHSDNAKMLRTDPFTTVSKPRNIRQG
jgi:hypothetical protein